MTTEAILADYPDLTPKTSAPVSPMALRRRALRDPAINAIHDSHPSTAAFARVSAAAAQLPSAEQSRIRACRRPTQRCRFVDTTKMKHADKTDIGVSEDHMNPPARSHHRRAGTTLQGRRRE